MQKRIFTPYEQNLLRQFGYDPFTLSEEVNISIPCEYIIGRAEFCQKYFTVDKSTLIPRIETEQIIDICIKQIGKRRHITFADIGTGSGCVGITLCMQFIKKNIEYCGYLCDISDSALKIAQQNAKELLQTNNFNSFTQVSNIGNENKFYNNIIITKSDLTSKLPQKKIFDLIVANLPYIPTSRLTSLSNSVKNHEPIAALNGGKDGFELIYRLLNQASNLLLENGILVLEVDDFHTQEFVLQKYPELTKKWDLQWEKDCFEKNRFIVGRQKLSSKQN
jgi:release factor glutamine methyltransferase